MIINFFQIIFYALLQGVTELFPISSLGHTVISTALLRWTNILNSDQFVPITVALHLGTTVALVIYFRKEWLELITNIYKNLKEGEVKQGGEDWVSWLVILGCIPAGLIGVFLEKPIKELFKSPSIIAVFLVINGIILLIGEKVKNSQKNKIREIRNLKWYEALIIGSAQAFALIPGISRSGITMVGGLFSGLTHTNAAKYSFLLGTPLIGAAAVLEIPQLFSATNLNLWVILVGTILSGITAYISTVFLLKYFKFGNLKPFGYYCIAFGLIAFVILMM